MTQPPTWRPRIARGLLTAAVLLAGFIAAVTALAILLIGSP